MIQLNNIEGTDIFEFIIEGNIDKDSVEKLYKLFELKAESNEKLKLLGTIHEFKGFEDFKAFSETLGMKAKAIGTISKYAVLSNRDWLETLMPIGNFITPGLPVKHFKLNEKSEAIAWLQAHDDTTVSAESYLSKMDVHNIKGTNIYSFTIDGKIDEGAMTALYHILNDKSRKGKINLLGYYKNFDGFQSFKAFTEGVKLDIAAFGNLDKFAIVTDKTWVKTLAKIESKMIPGITMKTFESVDQDKALVWLQE